MANPITIFMCGDVMSGRGIDQILPHPSEPDIYETHMKNAIGYVVLAEEVTGLIPYPVTFSYIWGYALEMLERVKPDLRMINLETAITRSNDYWEDKEIHYRMNPRNILSLTAAMIDCASLANNHILDWGYAGLEETLQVLEKAKIKSAGAGRSLKEARAPAVMEVADKGRVIMFSWGLQSSGIPLSWEAQEERPGINLLKDLSDKRVGEIRQKVKQIKQPQDIVVVSVHWGANWGYEVTQEERRFAHKLVDEAGVDIIHGHSSHHAKGIEVYEDKPIIYGCGDFLNDYEGIRGYEEFRQDLSLMYFVSMDPDTGKLAGLDLIPTQIKHFKVNRASRTDTLWLYDVLNREGKKFGTRLELNKDNTFTLRG